MMALVSLSAGFWMMTSEQTELPTEGQLAETVDLSDALVAPATPLKT